MSRYPKITAFPAVTIRIVSDSLLAASFLSGCHERHKGKSQCVLSVQKSEFGIEQGALRDLLEYTWHKHEQDTEKREVGCNDIQREYAVF
jgi:hypothetical protein